MIGLCNICHDVFQQFLILPYSSLQLFSIYTALLYFTLLHINLSTLFLHINCFLSFFKGDRVLTDVMFANQYGMLSVLVAPLSIKTDHPIAVIIRSEDYYYYRLCLLFCCYYCGVSVYVLSVSIIYLYLVYLCLYVCFMHYVLQI